jgi:hypothetical protein
MSQNAEVVTNLATNLVEQTVKVINTTEVPMSSQDISAVAGLFTSVIVGWFVKDNPDVPADIVVKNTLDEITTGVYIFLANQGIMPLPEALATQIGMAQEPVEEKSRIITLS